jgi:anti-anti-sigma factor
VARREGKCMEMTISDFGEAAKKVTLVGKLDIMGAEQIGLPLAALAGSRGNIVVDMTAVEFIASIGIRQLVMAAKAVTRGAGKLVLLDPNPTVTQVLAVSKIFSPSSGPRTRRGRRSSSRVTKAS